MRRRSLVSVAALLVGLGPASQAATVTVLYSFAGGADGAVPTSELLADAGGNLYGTTSQGGGSSVCRNQSLNG